MAQGKVEIGAFRTYPENYTPSDSSDGPEMTIPKGKVEDFGLHYKKYYKLPIEFYKSSVDSQLINLLFNRTWVNTLTASPLVANREYITNSIIDLIDQLKSAEDQLMHGGRAAMFGASAGATAAKKEESVLTKITRDWYVPSSVSQFMN